jgi:tRNA (uracil-5-)-methyltransferase
MRSEFRYWHEGDRSYYAMFHPEDRRTPVEVTEFPVATELTNKLMAQVREATLKDPELRNRLFQVEFLTTQSQDALITLIYHRQLGDEWEERARYWQEQWGYPVIGRARKQRLVLERDYVKETLTINGRTYTFKQYENSFTQPNAAVCEKMVGWAQRHCYGAAEKDLMELYCGNGNFSIPLASHFRKALGTEISRTSVKSAQENIELNDAANLSIARMASEDLSKAWIHNEPNRRFREFGIDNFDFDTVLVDPPRAGLDEDTIELIQRFRRVIYVSCNPESMIENIRGLKSSYEMTACALFDQFPYTHHMEAGVVLERK